MLRIAYIYFKKRKFLVLNVKNLQKRKCCEKKWRIDDNFAPVHFPFFLTDFLKKFTVFNKMAVHAVPLSQQNGCLHNDRIEESITFPLFTISITNEMK